MTQETKSPAEQMDVRPDYSALPCPFCGSNPVITAAQYGTVHCASIDCFGPRTTAQYLVDALKQWNTRSPAVSAGETEGWLCQVNVDGVNWEERFSFVKPPESRHRRNFRPLYAVLPPSNPPGAEPVGISGAMPGTSGFTMACFEADKVPLGTKLYANPPGDVREKVIAARRWAAKGDRMTFLGKNGYDFERETALKIFKVGENYLVEDCDVQSWSHSIKFVGIEHRYNGVMFEFASPKDAAATAVGAHQRGIEAD